MVEATTPSHDDDEKYLYGENNETPKTKTNGTIAEDVTTVDPQTSPSALGSLPSQETKKEPQDEDDEEDDGEFEEESDDDDDIQARKMIILLFFPQRNL